MASTEFSRASTRRIMLLCVYVLVASASFCGFFAKYAFRDSSTSDSIALMLDGTAERPYVYRQLLPAIANLADRVTPAPLKARFLAHLREAFPKHDWISNTFVNARYAGDPHYALRYYVMYFMVFAALVAALLMLRLVCLHLLRNEAAATLAPLIFALALPAGNFWDFPELFFMSTAVWIALRANLLWLVPVTLLATLNKESFLFFVIALYPFVRMRAPQRAAIAWVALWLAAAAAVNLFTKLHYAGNPGGVVQFHLFDNLRFLADPRNYFHGEYTYGVLLPKGFNVLLLFVTVVVVRAGWGRLPPAARQHAWLVFAMNVPLYLLFGYTDEIRALSLLDISGALLVCGALVGYVTHGREPDAATPASEAAVREECAAASRAGTEAQAAVFAQR